MSLTRSLRAPHAAAPAARRVRPISPRCRNGVSSLLRLTSTSATRFPTPTHLSGWMGRAADALIAADTAREAA